MGTRAEDGDQEQGVSPARRIYGSRADSIVRDYEAGLLPAPFMLKELERFIGMKTEEA